MRPITCLNPQSVINPYTHEHLVVSCGKCVACKNRFAKRWVDKLEQERRCWKYCFMVTLSYDDDHLPSLHDNGSCVLVDYKHGDRRISLDDLNITSQKDKKYLLARLNHRLGLPYCRVEDLQKFHKRLNKYIHDKITQKYQNFRYFVAAELGGTTLRPHYHGLYFFNDQRIARNFEEILFANWCNSYSRENGVKAVSVCGSAASYVAQYCNMFANLPSFYQSGALKPFHIFSKHPPLGSLSDLSGEIQKLFFSGSPTRTLYDAKRNKFCDVPLSHSLETRLYPRLPKYSEISLYVRVKLYGLAGESIDECFSSFLCYLKDSFGNKYFAPKFLKSSEHGVSLLQYIVWLTNNFRFKKSDYADVSAYDAVINRLKRFYYVSRRVCTQSKVFGISVRNYVQYIDNYYKNLENLKTKLFYEVQEKYSLSHDLEDLMYMYGDDVDAFIDFNQLEYVPQIFDTFAFRDLKSTSNKIYADSTKTHRKNEYLDKVKDKKLMLLIKDYFENV